MTTKVNNRMIDGAPISILDFGAVCDGVTDDSLAVQAALNAAASKNVSRVKGVKNCYIDGRIDIPRYVHLDFGYNRINMGANGEFHPVQGSSLTALKVDMGDDYLTVPTRSVCYLDGKERYYLQDGLITDIKLGVFSRSDSGVCVYFDARTDGSGTGASIVGVDLSLTVNQMEKGVYLVADNSADNSTCYINSNRLRVFSSASHFGIDEDIVTSTNTEMAENEYFVEYQTTNGGYAVPLNLEGDRTVVSGQIWDLHIASNFSNVRVAGDFNTIIGSGFPTEEDGRLSYTGRGLNQMGGLGGTPRSRIYSSVAERTHCRYLGIGRNTTDLMSAPYVFTNSAFLTNIAGNDYATGTQLLNRTITKDNFDFSEGVKVKVEVAGKCSTGNNTFGLGLRVNGTTRATLRKTDLPDGGSYRGTVIMHFEPSSNKMRVTYDINGEVLTLLDEDVADLSVNGASIEVYAFGANASGTESQVASLEAGLSYKFA